MLCGKEHCHKSQEPQLVSPTMWLIRWVILWKLLHFLSPRLPSLSQIWGFCSIPGGSLPALLICDSQPPGTVLTCCLSASECDLFLLNAQRGGKRRKKQKKNKNPLFLWNFPRHTPRQSYVFGPVGKGKAHETPQVPISPCFRNLSPTGSQMHFGFREA